MSQAGLTRKEKERLQHKAAIMSVALDLFSEKGFHDVSMQEIAAASEFAVGTLYNFFDNKEALFLELMKDCANKVAAVLLPILDEAEDEKRKISKYIRTHKQIIKDYAQAIRLYLSQNFILGNAMTREIELEADTLQETIRRKLSEVIESAIRKGVFRTIDPRTAAIALGAALEALVTLAIRQPQTVAIDNALEEIQALFFDGILEPTGASDEP